MTSKKKAKARKPAKRRARSAGSGDGANAEKTFAAFDDAILEATDGQSPGATEKGQIDNGKTGKRRAQTARGDDGQSDDALWAAVSKTVKPLARKSPAVPNIPTQPTPSPKPDAQSRAARKTPAVRRQLPQPPAPPIQRSARPPVLEHGAAPGVDKRTATKLRRGLMPIEATIDLHGLNRDDARGRLTGFLSGHHAAGRRCVLVITGKGLKDDWSPGVIRSAVPGWLNEAPLRELVLSFATAQPKDGGSGAIYVLLKRTRT